MPFVPSLLQTAPLVGDKAVFDVVASNGRFFEDGRDQLFYCLKCNQIHKCKEEGDIIYTTGFRRSREHGDIPLGSCHRATRIQPLAFQPPVQRENPPK